MLPSKWTVSVVVPNVMARAKANANRADDDETEKAIRTKTADVPNDEADREAEDKADEDADEETEDEEEKHDSEDKAYEVDNEKTESDEDHVQTKKQPTRK